MDDQDFTESIEATPKITPEVVAESVKPITKTKRELSPRQLESLKKAREAKSSKKNSNPPLIKTKDINMNYMLMSGSLGLGALLLYYYLKPQKKSQDTHQEERQEISYQPQEQPKSKLDSFY